MNNKEILKELLYAIIVSVICTFVISLLMGSFAYFITYTGIGIIGVASAKFYIWNQESSKE